MRRLCLIAASVAVLAVAEPAAAARVAAIISAELDEYRAALQGFEETVDVDIVATYDMEGDPELGRRILDEITREVRPDLVLAVGVWALETVLQARVSLPVIYIMVLNPPSLIGPVPVNVTGASMNVSVADTIRLLRQLGPEIRRIGVIFSPDNTGYLVADAKAIARDAGLELITRKIASPKEAIGALRDLQQSGVDALWILPDANALGQRVVEYTMLLSYRHKIPVLGLSERQAMLGAVLSLSFASSRDIGRQAGELAKLVLAGKPPAEIPYTTARMVKLTVNLKAAKKLGLEVPESIVGRAQVVIR